ncbi:uncharacterized protein EDB93DRAFT_1271543 [Suillus bovinus]|uniref:uncharacterized protein n=1 Tax=Suillus bovinus TaxID=48563 RepID=UPI001B8651CA|nr:uncharacterized protein EDB93DRAFT_1271543 [Suillus bovinus]KAG2153612.1 hypothetical protein EDB93DRAFT_1271543 [Suillus bovinus]
MIYVVSLLCAMTDHTDHHKFVIVHGLQLDVLYSASNRILSTLIILSERVGGGYDRSNRTMYMSLDTKVSAAAAPRTYRASLQMLSSNMAEWRPAREWDVSSSALSICVIDFDSLTSSNLRNHWGSKLSSSQARGISSWTVYHLPLVTDDAPRGTQEDRVELEVILNIPNSSTHRRIQDSSEQMQRTSSPLKFVVSSHFNQESEP